MFSLTPIAKEPPVVPIPAPAEISPVGRSSTLMSICFKLLLEPSVTSYFTALNMFRDFIFAIDFSKFNLENGSPSSKINSPLITSSLVILFPNTLTPLMLLVCLYLSFPF